LDDVVLQVTDKYYKHISVRVININSTTIMRDLPVFEYRTKLGNRSVTVLHDKKEKTELVIDVAILDDSNVNMKETEKLSNYKDLNIDVSRMWKVRIKIVPAITGALGTNKKGLDQNLSCSQVTRRSQSYRRSS
jgi:hypothetical protein